MGLPLITDQELEELTGVRQTAAQIRWLREHRVPFTRRRDGKPRTTWTLYESALLGRSEHRPRLDRVR